MPSFSWANHHLRAEEGTSLPRVVQVLPVGLQIGRRSQGWVGTRANPTAVRDQSAIDRHITEVYDLAIEGESYRRRQNPQLGTG